MATVAADRGGGGTIMEACKDCFMISSQLVLLFFFLVPFVPNDDESTVAVAALVGSCCVLNTLDTSTSSWDPKLFQLRLLVRSSIALDEGLVPAVKATVLGAALPLLVVAVGRDVFKVANMDSKKAPPDEDDERVVGTAGGFKAVSTSLAAAAELMELREFNSLETTDLNISCRKMSVTESVD